MTGFEHHWRKTADASAPSQIKAWVRACAAARLLPPRLLKLIEGRNPALLRQFVKSRAFADDADSHAAIATLLAKLADEWKTAAARRDSAPAPAPCTTR